MDYIFNNFDEVSQRLYQHLQLTAYSLIIAIIVALPLGLLISRVKPLSTPILTVLGIIYTMPSLALFALLVPFLGLGFLPAISVLVAYSQLSLVRNVALGFDQIDPPIKEAARGMGMSSWQRLTMVELPLALPIIIAGIRIAALLIIGIGTIAAWIGAGGLGQLLLNGVGERNNDKILAGAVMIALLSISVDLLFRLLERLTTPSASLKPGAQVKADELDVQGTAVG